MKDSGYIPRPFRVDSQWVMGICFPIWVIWNSKLAEGLRPNGCSTLRQCDKHLFLKSTGITSNKPATLSAWEALAAKWMDGWTDDGARKLQQLISFITPHICSFCVGKKDPYSAADQQYRRSPCHHWFANLHSAHNTTGWAVENFHSSTYLLVAKGESGILRMHMSFACLD